MNTSQTARESGAANAVSLPKVVTVGGIALGLLLLIVVFQVALALGAPFGKAAWGGQNDDVLPGRLRAASAIAGVVIYPAVIALVSSASGVIDADLVPGKGDVAMWFLATLFGLGGIANAVSRSSLERWWSPVSLTVAVCCAYIATQL